ncbi:DUF4153 domain-containing protein [Kitasatospora mediocidica]|uniref:DUF4153 domain-containing protein n=1 Tax=Kitasatospora mediocidica TaxID=58352 RepID=UPI0009FDC3C1|nr:DUF4173 domain-containing protein [Kitasatospora mediocidica]
MSDPSTAATPKPQPQPGPGPQPGPSRPTAGDPFRVPGQPAWGPRPAPKPLWEQATEPPKPAAPALRVPAAGLAAGLLSAAVLSDGIGVNLLLCALAAAVVAGLAVRQTGRRVRPWTLLWAGLTIVLLAVPALSDAGWPTCLAVVMAVALGSLALHGGARWTGVLLGSLGIWGHLVAAPRWVVSGLLGRQYPARARVVSLLKASAVAVGLLVVFGGLFASADSGMASLLGGLLPSADLSDLPLRGLTFLLGLLVALAAAHAVAAPRRWDRFPVKAGRPRGRLEWAVPLAALNLLFGVFVVEQVLVLFGGYEAVMSKPGILPAEYARQGFWQLLWVTVLTLGVVALARRWAPRATAGDRLLVKGLLGLLGTLTLGVVASALYRMLRYMDNFGLTRLRLSVAALELWLGVVFLLVIVGGVLTSQRWLPRAVMLSAAVAVGAFGLVGPDRLIAEQNVAHFQKTGHLDVAYLQGLSADAVPALQRLPDSYRDCTLLVIDRDLGNRTSPWYATSLAASRARQILRDHPVGPDADWECARLGQP